jgi:hypothetical protein
METKVQGNQNRSILQRWMPKWEVEVLQLIVLLTDHVRFVAKDEKIAIL